jgi:hypothetical protein
MKKRKKMNILSQPEYHVDYVEWDSSLSFTVEEACQLLNHEVIRLEDRAYLPIPPNDKVGIIVGVLTMNEEVEVLVKFFSTGMEQLVKTELCGDYIVVPD